MPLIYVQLEKKIYAGNVHVKGLNTGNNKVKDGIEGGGRVDSGTGGAAKQEQDERWRKHGEETCHDISMSDEGDG